jgi:Tol biopolymer transport system component
VTPVFAPSGSVVYFASKMSLTTTSTSWNVGTTSSYNIWSVNTDGTGLTDLTSQTATARDSENPMPSPDGTTIAFQSKMKIGTTTSNSFNIWTMSAGGTSQTALTTNTTTAEDSTVPQWSADGTEIVFESKMPVGGVTPSSNNVWIMSSTGASQVALTTNTASGLDSTLPIFSPDDLKIAFVSLMDIGSTATTSTNIWVMNADGTGTPTALTTNTNAGLSSTLGSRGVWFEP